MPFKQDYQCRNCGKIFEAKVLTDQEIEKLRKDLGLTPEELNLDLGPLGKLF